MNDTSRVTLHENLCIEDEFVFFFPKHNMERVPFYRLTAFSSDDDNEFADNIADDDSDFADDIDADNNNDDEPPQNDNGADIYPLLDWKDVPTVEDEPSFLHSRRKMVDVPHEDFVRDFNFHSTDSLDYIRIETDWRRSPVTALSLLQGQDNANNGSFQPFVFYPSMDSIIKFHAIAISHLFIRKHT
jgi:hypothetical protein